MGHRQYAHDTDTRVKLSTYTQIMDTNQGTYAS